MGSNASWTTEEQGYVLNTATTSFYKALLLGYEAGRVGKQGFLSPAVFGLYNALYHLGLSHLLAQREPPTLKDENDKQIDWTKRLRKKIAEEGDLIEVVGHEPIRAHLKACSDNQRIQQLAAAHKELWGLRNDLQYGPRLRREGNGFVLDSCKNPADTIKNKLDDHLHRWESYIHDFSDDAPFLISGFVLQDKYLQFFLENPSGLAPYYTEGSVRQAKAVIEDLKKRLWPNQSAK